MEPRHWDRVSDILDEAVKCPPGERSARLDRLCGGDASLRREVDSLLSADAGVLRRLDRPAFCWFPGEALATGSQRLIGPYRVLRELGRGGAAVVYLGRRDGEEDPRPVALKVLRPGTESPSGIRRFRTEAEILSRLRHPNVAELYGGGTTDDGRPFLVMEYVEGVPIDRFCDAGALPVAERLRLFLKVCEAVQYAHQKLIVHRDLKPSNVLVTPSGEPKLLDFGISRLLDPASSFPQPLTATGLRALTPKYSSPEQIRSQPVSIASDVYSLGVVLYRLLTGSHPYSVDGLELSELRQVICTVEPKRPSQRLEDRKVEDRRLRRRLRGDLDNIVLMALRKEPERRYASVERLASDLRRHLEHRPVEARQAGLAYRAGKFLTRRAREVSVILAVGLLVGAVLLDRGRKLQQIAEERAIKQQVAEFMVALFGEADPGRTRGEAVTVREVLDRGAARIDRLTADPAVQASLMSTIGRVYLNLGDHDSAAPLLRASHQRRLRLYGGDHASVAESLAQLGALSRARGDYEAAESRHRQALAMRRRLFGEHHAEVAESMDSLAVTLHEMGRLEEAEPLSRGALALRRQLLEPEDPAVALSLGNLGALLTQLGDYARAEPLLLEALALRRRVHLEDHPELVNALNNLGNLYWNRRDYAASEPLYRESLAMRRRLYTGDHPEISTGLNNLGSVFHGLRRYAEAQELYAESLAMDRRVLGDSHPEIGVTLLNLGTVAVDRGELEGAEPLLREALSIFKQEFGEQHPRVATGLVNLANLLTRTGGHDEAEGLYRRALEIRRELLRPDHPEVGLSSLFLARLLLIVGKPAEAEGLAREAVEILARQLPEGHWRTAQAGATLGSAISRLGRFGEAEPLLEEAYDAIQSSRGRKSRLARAVATLLADHYELSGQPALAAEYRSPAIEAELQTAP